MSENPLQSLRVLITRPEGRADALIAEITALGGKATHIPLLTVAPLDEKRDAAICAATGDHFRALDTYQRVIAISVNALHFAVPWIKKYWPALPDHIVWYGIGAATVTAFTEYGIFARGGHGAMTSESLLAADDLQKLTGERILILRGVGGREQLAMTLRERGAQVEHAECYRRREPELSAQQIDMLQAMTFDAICVNSDETLRNLWQCLAADARERVCRCALIVPSERVAETARKFGFMQIITANNAGTEATLAVLKTLPKRNH